MLISHRLQLLRILSYTWKIDLSMIATCAIVYYLQADVFPTGIQIPITAVTLLGTAIAFFIGFNNNQAYGRWWEARIIWGSLVNDSRSWARNLLEYTSQGNLSEQDLEEIKTRMIRRHLGFIYSLKESLRGTPNQDYKKFLYKEEMSLVNDYGNVPNAILSFHSRDLQHLSDNNAIDQFRFMQLNQLITSFTDSMGKCERIKTTVFPTTYVYFTRLFIWVFVIFITLVLADSVSKWSILISWVIGFIFHVTHQNGMSLMNPFENIPSGIPLDQISRTIEINLLEMLGDDEIPKPIEAVNNEYIM
jgi:ion channel-forming bestrophin family protein